MKSDDFMPDIYRKLDWLSKEDLIKRMVSLEFNRFLDYYRDREEIEIATGSERSAKSGERGSNARKATPGFKRLFINLGKMDNFFPNELISLLNNNTRGRVELGRIDLMQKSLSLKWKTKKRQRYKSLKPGQLERP